VYKKTFKGFCLAFVLLSILSAKTGHAATAIVPTGYPTVQQAVNAVQGTVTPLVIINSNATFTETVTITQSVTIEAGSGYTPTIQGTGACYSSGCAIYFNPNSASDQSLTLRNLILLPRTGIGPGSGDGIIDIQNAGTGATNILFDGLTLNDPGNGGPDGINIRSGYGGPGGGPNNVTIQQNTSITLGGGPGYSATAIFMGETGTLSVSNVTINLSLGDGEGFDIRGSQGSGITFTLDDSTFNMSAPLGPYSSEIGRVSDTVTATFRGNTFNLTSNAQGSSSGIIAGWGSQNVTMDANWFNGIGPNANNAFSANPFAGDTVSVTATNNIIINMGGGFQLNPQSGTPGGIVNATLTNNTIDGSEGSAVYFSANDGGAINSTTTNNLFTNNSRYAFEGYLGAGSTINSTNNYNDFYNNAMGLTDGTVTIGSNALYVGPAYVNRAGGDLHLQATSPVVNMGDNSAPSIPATDADGNPRIFGGTVDMGAFELQRAAIPTTPGAPDEGWSSGSILRTPNPGDSPGAPAP